MTVPTSQQPDMPTGYTAHPRGGGFDVHDPGGLMVASGLPDRAAASHAAHQHLALAMVREDEAAGPVVREKDAGHRPGIDEYRPGDEYKYGDPGEWMMRVPIHAPTTQEIRQWQERERRPTEPDAGRDTPA